MNQKQVIYLIFLSTMVANVKAQDIHFSLHANLLYLNSKSYFQQQSDSTTFIRFVNDSTAIRQRGFSESSSQQDYNGGPGFSLGAKIHFQLSDRFSIVTGLSTVYNRFRKETDLLFSKFTIASSDTISYFWIHNPNFHCDEYENNIQDLGSIPRGTLFNMLFLNIPFELNYTIIPGKLHLTGGVFLQTPLHVKASFSYVSIEHKMTGGKTICKYIVRELSGALAYQMTDHVKLNIAARQTIQNVFTNSNNTFSNSGSVDYNPVQFSMGIEYSFGNFIRMNSAN
jgi:hypothetical protein